MCDTTIAKFFRPWNSRSEKSSVDERDIDNSVNAPANEETRVKCEPEEDDVSVASGSSNDCTDYSVRTSSPAATSSCSAASEEPAGSLNMLSNFVYKTRCDEPPATEGSVGSSCSNDSCRSTRTSGEHHRASACEPIFEPTATHRFPLYPLEYPAPHLGAGFVPLETPASSPTFPDYVAQSIYYGPYAPYASVEDAVKYIHQQEAVAKQMKKLRPKKFRCEHCDVAFSNNGQLKGHIRIHTGERPFKCDAEGCGKSFTRNEELTRHKRIHTGLRPHSCVLCGKRFGRKDHLKKHTRTHDNRGPYYIPITAASGPFGLPPLPSGHPIPPYLYPI